MADVNLASIRQLVDATDFLYMGSFGRFEK